MPLSHHPPKARIHPPLPPAADVLRRLPKLRSVLHGFSNLEATISPLLMNPSEAKRIADNSVKTIRECYLTPAAEACYWRKLTKAWKAVSFELELYETVQVRHSQGD